MFSGESKGSIGMERFKKTTNKGRYIEQMHITIIYIEDKFKSNR